MPRQTQRDYPLRFVGRRIEEAVEAYRQEHGFEIQEAVAIDLGISPGALSHWIHGQSHPGPKNRRKVLALGITEEELSRLEALDKLDKWRRPGVAASELVEMAQEIQAEQEELEGGKQARVA